ncbi:MAG: GTP-binding protein [Spirochaetes bacterium GWB1_48_6]|nr:MAG: GTP-binding protein [Spirochaetes bacterium GWB1_48_6]
MVIKTDALRNLSIIGHTATGKTTLTEQLLFSGGVIPKPEKVESGRTVSYHTEEEIKRGLSIHTSVSHIFWKNTKINLLDTPGSGDFVGEVILAFRATECALVVVGGRSGVQIETLKLWRELNHRNLPRMVFVNKLDKADTDFFETREELKDKFQIPFIPVTIPMGHDRDFKGVISLMDMKAWFYSPDGKKETPGDIPAEYQELAQKWRLTLMEEAAEGDEELLEKYVETGTLDEEEIKKGLREGLEKNTFVPVFCGSATHNSGLIPLLDFTAYDSPSPFKIEEPCIYGEKTRMISPEGKFSGFIYKTTNDQFAGKLSFIKVVTGKLSNESEAYNPRTQKKEKIGKIFISQGRVLEEVSELSAGDVGLLSKYEHLATNDTLGPSDDIIHYLPLQMPKPVHSLAINAKQNKDEDKMSAILIRAGEEDLTFQIRYNHETKETVISSMGELQMGIILDRVRSAKIEFVTRVPRIPYRETITRGAAAEYTHKKQTGGHGQYGKVMMEVKALPRGDKFEFTNTLKGQNLSKSYLPAIEKGIQECLHEGILAGYPIVDVGVNVSDGKEHPVDSSELAFKLAAKGALKEAFGKCGPIILEPIMNLTIYIDEKYLGEILADLSAKRARVLGQEPIGKDMVEIKAQVPQGEMMQYALELKSLTSGTGGFDLDFDHYSQLGPKESQNLIHEYEAHRKAGISEH